MQLSNTNLMNHKFHFLVAVLLVIGVRGNLLFGQVPPCSIMMEQHRAILYADSFQLDNITCPTCIYSWNPAPAVGATDSIATYVPSPNWDGYPNLYNSWWIDGLHSDPTATNCTGTGRIEYQVAMWGREQMSPPQLLNGPFDGDTSKTWIYTRRHSEGDYPSSQQVAFLSSWGYLRNYQISGGVVQSSHIAYQANDFPFAPIIGYVDTLWIKWNRLDSMFINCNGNVTGTFTFLPIFFTQWSGSPISEDYLLPIPEAFVLGDSIACVGDTQTFRSGYLPGAVYDWSVTNANILSGQGSDSISVLWTGLPGTVSLERIYNSDTSNSSLSVGQASPASVYLGADTTICPQDTLTLAADPAASYLWSTGSIQQSQQVWTSGSVWVEVTAQCGDTDRDTIQVDLHPINVLDIGPDTAICPGDPVIFHAPATWTVQQWSDGSLADSLLITQPGVYFLNATDTNACPDSDTLLVQSLTPIQADLGPDDTLCPPATALLSPGNGFNTFLWQNGSTAPTLSASGPGWYWVEAIDAAGCSSRDSLYLGEHPPFAPQLGPDTAICMDTFLVLGPSGAISNFLWQNGAVTTNQVVNGAGLYWLEGNGPNGCTGRDSIQVDVLLDCVFPGDCDYDGVANNYDVLAIGSAFSSNGPVRPVASLQWYGQPNADWSASLPNGANYKQVDSDGSGLVNADDTLAITLNYGATHNKTGGLQSAIPLNLFPLFDSVLAGDTAVYAITLGDSTSSVDSVYGLAFTVAYDTSVVDSQGLFFADFSNCWIGPQSILLTFALDHYPTPEADLAVVRTDLQDTSGHGEVCRIGFVTIDNISGKKDLLTKPMVISLTDAGLVDREMHLRTLEGGVDTAVVYAEELALEGHVSETDLQVYPLPASDHLVLSLKGDVIEQWEMYDLKGRLVRKGTGDQSARIRLDIRDWPGGFYLLQATSTKGIRFSRKVAIRP